VAEVHKDYKSGSHSIAKCVYQDHYCQALSISRDHAFDRHGSKAIKP